MAYKIAVSSGLYRIAQDLNLLGLGRKVTSVATYGVNYVQADVENPSEFVEPNFVEQIKHAKDGLGIEWGLHGEIDQTVAFEVALEILWKQAQRRLHQYLDLLYEKFIENKMNDYRPSYIDFHVSQFPVIGFIVERYRFAGYVTVDFNGKSDWSELLEKEPKLLQWFKESGLLETLLSREIAIRRIEEWKEIISKEFEEKTKRKPTDQEIYDLIYKEWIATTSRSHGRGSIPIEDFAYVIVAKYLEIKKNDPSEPLWKLFFGNKSMSDLEKDWGKKIYDHQKGEVYLHPDLTAMVASRYIIGHFKAEPLKEYLAELSKKRKIKDFHKKNALSKLKDIKVTIVFENPEVEERGMEGLSRIIHADHMYNLAKAFNHPYIKLLIDFEHYVHNGLDPLKEIESTPEDFGKYVFACHIYAPTGLHAHTPIDVGSENQRIVYEYLYELRKKGMKDAIFIFERGGGKDPGEYIRSSVVALKMIVEQLEKNTNPEKLPPEFYGVSPQGFFSEEKQKIAIKQHALDPLKGTLVVPEEEYTFLSSEAIKKGKKPEEWKKEEYR